MTAETTVYGASDDLIEIEGPIREEFNVYEDSVVEFSNGVTLSVRYDGRWHIEQIDGPADVEVTIERATAYSDVARFTAPVDWVRQDKA